jgi:hypothetical protein
MAMCADESDPIVVKLAQLLKPARKSKPITLGPVPEERVAAAERELGLRFPESYRTFLRRYGAGFLFGYEIAGVPLERCTDEEPPFWCHVADDTLGYRQAAGLPEHYVVISGDGGDYWFLLDTSQTDANGECPVVAWGSGADGPVVAANFLDFLQKIRAGGRLL